MERFLSSLYYGPNTSRNAQDYANEWKNTDLGSVDSLVLMQLQLARQLNQKTVRLLDVGSGQRADMLRSLITNPVNLLESRQFMQANPDMELDLIGLTDANNKFEADYPSFVQHITEPNFKTSLKIYPYTLTASQTIEGFLNNRGIKDVQLATAIWSLAYLGPKTFEEVLKSISSALSAKSLFVGVGYTESIAGLGFNVNFRAYPVVYPQRKVTSLNPENWKDILGKGSTDLCELALKELNEAKMTMSQGISALVRGNMLDMDKALEIEQSLWESQNIHQLTLVGSELQIPFFNLWKNKFGLLKEKKMLKYDH